MKYIFYIVTLSLSVTLHAQDTVFVNQGDMSIEPGTEVSTYFAFENTATGNVFNHGALHFYDNYRNDGLFTYSDQAQSGYVVFEGKGSGVQQLMGDQPSKFYDVLFNKPGSGTSFDVSHEVLVGHQTDFSNGVVLVDPSQGGAFVFLKGAQAVHASDQSHVEGSVTKEGKDAFTYPIGKSGFYRFAAIAAQEAEAHSYAGEYFYKNSNTSYPHANRTGVIAQINDKEYWNVAPVNNGSKSVILTLSWDERTTPSQLLSNGAKELHIVRWDKEQKLWVDEGGIVDYANKTVSTPVKVDDFGIFTLGKVKSNLLLEGDVVVYNGVTPDGDGKNDYFIIDNIQHFPNNTVTIYNRWGREVYQTQNYDSRGNVFKGYAEGVTTFQKGEKLPSGTYYYVLEYMYDRQGENRLIKKAGYLHLENN